MNNLRSVSVFILVVVIARINLQAEVFQTIDFSVHHNKRIQLRNSLYPEGSVTLGGVPFDIPIGGNNEWGSGNGIGGGGGNNGTFTIDIGVGVFGAKRVFTLINTDWGTTSGGRMLIEFFGSDGAYLQKDLIGNDDMRDWNGFFTNTINGTTTTNVVFIPVGMDGNPDFMDMQRFELPGDFLDEILTTIRVTDTRNTFVHSGLLSGLTLEVSPLLVPLDIKPGSCPNSFNRRSHGVLPVAIVGSDDFDVTLVDTSTVQLSRVDGVGGSATPNEGPPGPHSTIDDVATPFAASMECECDALAGDGILDLSMKFRSDDVVAALELNALPAGDLVPLVVTGTLLDGTPFETATDCIRLVPPGTPPGMLTVESNMSAAWLDVSPLDIVLDGGGFASFDRVFPLGTVVTLTAEATMNGRPLIAWWIDGVTIEATSPARQIVMTGDTTTVRAIYRSVTSNNMPMLQRRGVNSGPSEPQ